MRSTEIVPRIDVSFDGPDFSRLAFGTWRILDDNPPLSTTDILARLEVCIDLGITTIDTAEIYGGYQVETALGETFRKKPSLRSQIEIVTKAGIDIPSPEKPHAQVNHYDTTAKNLVACVEKSLRLFDTDFLDLFLVHRPDWLTAAEDTAQGINRLIADGKILHAGVSNYTPSQFAALSSFVDRPLVTNQVETSLLHMDALYDGTLDQCQEYEICPMGWSPLAQGKLFDETRNDAAKRIQRLTNDVLTDKYDASLDQLAFAWLLAHPANIIPIIGTTKLDRLQTLAQSASIRLERQDWFALWEAAQGHSVP